MLFISKYCIVVCDEENDMPFYGILPGLISFLSIGVFHPIVIRCEYLFSCRSWPAFLIVGLVLDGISEMLSNLIPSAIIGIIGFFCISSILFQQNKLVERGWFPASPSTIDKKTPVLS